MDEKTLSKLKLNKQNVISVFLSCKATPNTPKENITEDQFYSHSFSTRKAPLMQFDYIKVGDNIPLINYLFGQLKIVHERKDPFTPAQGIIDYTGKRWTDNDNALYALYYLATTALTFPYFVDGEKGSEAQDMTFYYDHGLIPTYPPEDPRFNIKDAKRALECLGVELPEGQNHDDK